MSPSDLRRRHRSWHRLGRTAALPLLLLQAGCAAAPLAGQMVAQAAPSLMQRAIGPSEEEVEIDALRSDVQALLQMQCDQLLQNGQPMPDACMRAVLPAAGATVGAPEPAANATPAAARAAADPLSGAPPAATSPLPAAPPAAVMATP